MVAVESQSAPPILTVNLTKSFGGVHALKDVNLSVTPGQITAIVGENGAGKSTLMKVLAGYYPHGSYSGEIRVNGQLSSFRTVHDAEEQGLVLVPQELNTIPELSIAENIFLNRGMGFLVDHQVLGERARPLLERLNLDADPLLPMKKIGIGQQQLVLIARALAAKARYIIFDEPTAAIGGRDVDTLFAVMRQLKDSGILSIFISHRLDEVFKIADRIVVMRDGRIVATEPVANTSTDAVISYMLGRQMSSAANVRKRKQGGTVLEVTDICVPDRNNAQRLAVDHVSLSANTGEILGIFGLVGAGRTELGLALFGAWPRQVRGKMRVAGRELEIHSPAEAIAAGIVYMPEDRRQQGLFFNMTVSENINIGDLGTVSQFQVLDNSAISARTVEYGERLRIRCGSWDVPVGRLSGGNQQKVLLSRLLAMKPRVLILDEPTRGIDVAAKDEIHKLLFRLADSGLAIIVISSESEEILSVSDRICVFYKGKVARFFSNSRATSDMLLKAAVGE